MRLVYIHKSLNATLTNCTSDWQQRQANNPLLTVDFATDGHPIFLDALLRYRVVDEVLVIIESARGAGVRNLGRLKCLVMPNLTYLKDMLKPDDVLYWRGGYHWWIEHLNDLKDYWHIYYGAGTPRAHWPQWDVILYEGQVPISKRGKLYLPWNKPININLFKPDSTAQLSYDVCISASKIFDIKQQYKTVDALLAYRTIYNKDLKAILPGAVRSSTQTDRVLKMMKTEKLDISMPGYVDRSKLAQIYNRSKLITHHASGLNDRCVLEATACGVPLLSLSEGGGRYPQWIKDIRFLAKDSSPDTLARAIHHALENLPPREDIVQAFRANNKIKDTVDIFAKLFPLLTYPKDRSKLANASEML